MLTVDFDRLGLRPGERLLDLGCGGGRHAFEAMKRGAAVTALDYSEGELKDVRATVGGMLAAGEIVDSAYAGVANGDALDLPFPDAAFDRIICSEVLEHIWDDRRAIAELARVLRPGGRLAVTVPTRWPERVCWALDRHYHDTPGGHVRIYRQAELERRLESAGLFLRGSHHAHALHSPYWWLRAAVGVERAAEHPAVRAYERFLVGCIEGRYRFAGRLERALDPVLGKSLVIYTERVPPAMARHAGRSGGAHPGRAERGSGAGQ
jgi:SAM-dependent methyltransferase